MIMSWTIFFLLLESPRTCQLLNDGVLVQCEEESLVFHMYTFPTNIPLPFDTAGMS